MAYPLGRQVRKMREADGISQGELAEPLKRLALASVSAPTVSRAAAIRRLSRPRLCERYRGQLRHRAAGQRGRLREVALPRKETWLDRPAGPKPSQKDVVRERSLSRSPRTRLMRPPFGSGRERRPRPHNASASAVPRACG